jgi:hypothetical protein
MEELHIVFIFRNISIVRTAPSLPPSLPHPCGPTPAKLRININCRRGSKWRTSGTARATTRLNYAWETKIEKGLSNERGRPVSIKAHTQLRCRRPHVSFPVPFTSQLICCHNRHISLVVSSDICKSCSWPFPPYSSPSKIQHRIRTDTNN